MATHEKLVDTIEDASLRIYPSRFWVVMCFSFFTILQGGLWAIPGPLSGAYSNPSTYGLDGNTIQLLVNWGPIMYLPFAAPFAVWMDRKGGMRGAVLLCHVLTTLGAALRVLAGSGTFTLQANMYVLHLSYILNAIAGPVAMGAVGRISELWFPVTSRGTATAIMAESNEFGAMFAYLVGPAMVPDNTMEQLQSFNWLCLALCVAVLLMIAVYFPSAPPTPPSKSAIELRAREAGSPPLTLRGFFKVLWTMMHHRSFMVLICAYGFSTGMYGSWAALMSLNLPAFTATLAGYLSFTATVGGNLGGLLLGQLLDRFRYLGPKRLLVGFMGLAGLAFLGFAVVVSLCDTTSGSTVAALFALGAIGGFAINSCLPLFFELSIEISHPQPEASIITILTVMNNVGCLVFLGIPVDQEGSGWMNWLFAATVLFFTLALAIWFQETSLRYDVDKGVPVVEDDASGHRQGLLGLSEREVSGILGTPDMSQAIASLAGDEGLAHKVEEKESLLQGWA